MIVFAISLSLADYHYGRGWPPNSMDKSMRQLDQARRLYPFLPRFQNGMAVRMQMFAGSGM